MIIPILNEDIREVPASVLAYIGDSVYELHVRLYVASRCHQKSGAIHRTAISYVSASAQAKAARSLIEELSEEEAAVFRRGKNSNPGSVAKNASPSDYKYATGLEAVIGYLFLQDSKARLDELLSLIISRIEASKGE